VKGKGQTRDQGGSDKAVGKDQVGCGRVRVCIVNVASELCFQRICVSSDQAKEWNRDDASSVCIVGTANDPPP
jgi:hypothetical protein